MTPIEVVENIKKFGEFLIPYNFPIATTEDEDAINIIKTKEVVIDGYNLIIHYNKAKYKDHYLTTLQILGRWSPFLPFSLVCKIGKKFLGDQHLSLVEIFVENRKIYCW